MVISMGLIDLFKNCSYCLLGFNCLFNAKSCSHTHTHTHTHTHSHIRYFSLYRLSPYLGIVTKYCTIAWHGTNFNTIAWSGEKCVSRSFVYQFSLCPHCVWNNPPGTSSDSRGDPLEQSCLGVGNFKTRTLCQPSTIIYSLMFRLHIVACEIDR